MKTIIAYLTIVINLLQTKLIWTLVILHIFFSWYLSYLINHNMAIWFCLACYSSKFPFDSIILFNLLLFCLLVSFCRIHISSKFTTCDYEQSTNDSLPLLCFASKWGNKSCRRSSTPRLDLGKVVTNVVWIMRFWSSPHVINMAYFLKKL